MFNNLSPKQLAFCVGYGLALWLGAIFLVRAIGPMGAFSGMGLVISFIALIPGTLPAVLLTKSVMGPFFSNALWVGYETGVGSIGLYDVGRRRGLCVGADCWERSVSGAHVK
jgi:hypothetical protein